MIVWWRRTPSNVAPIPSSAVRECSFRAWVLNSTRSALERLERVGAAGAASPRGWRRSAGTPVPIHVQPISSRRCSGAIVMKRLLPIARPDGEVDRRERDLGAGLGVGQGRSSQRAGRRRRSAGAIVQRQIARRTRPRARSSRWRSASGSMRTRDPSSVTGVTQVWARHRADGSGRDRRSGGP